MPAPAELHARGKAAPKRDGNGSGVDVLQMPAYSSMYHLKDKTFPEPAWVIPGIIPEGVTLLAGKPKTGKSFLAMNIAQAKSLGGKAFGSVDVQKEGVFYLCMEDREHWLQTRAEDLFGPDFTEWPKNYYYALNWPRADQGGITLLQQWLEEHPDVKLVIVDTLKKVRSRESGSRNAYDVEYEQIEYLKNVADTMGVSILIVHHLRKLDGEDPFDSISGSTGLTAAIDNGMILKQQGRKGKLYVRGRFIEERELALERDDSGGWTLLGDAAEVAMSEEQDEVLSLLKEARRPVKLNMLCTALGKKNNTMHKLMAKLVHQGQVVQPKYGLYALPGMSQDGGRGEGGGSCGGHESGGNKNGGHENGESHGWDGNNENSQWSEDHKSIKGGGSHKCNKWDESSRWSESKGSGESRGWGENGESRYQSKSGESTNRGKSGESKNRVESGESRNRCQSKNLSESGESGESCRKSLTQQASKIHPHEYVKSESARVDHCSSESALTDLRRGESFGKPVDSSGESESAQRPTRRESEFAQRRTLSRGQPDPTSDDRMDENESPIQPYSGRISDNRWGESISAIPSYRPGSPHSQREVIPLHPGQRPVSPCGPVLPHSPSSMDSPDSQDSPNSQDSPLSLLSPDSLVLQDPPGSPVLPALPVLRDSPTAPVSPDSSVLRNSPVPPASPDSPHCQSLTHSPDSAHSSGSLDLPHPPSPLNRAKIKCIDCSSYQAAEKPNFPGSCTGDPFDGDRVQLPQVLHDCDGFRPRVGH